MSVYTADMRRSVRLAAVVLICAAPASAFAQRFEFERTLDMAGPATLEVNDQGTALRFNFPAAARFRPLTWDEWFAIFDRHGLVFVFEGAHLNASTRASVGGAYFRIVSPGGWGDRPLVEVAAERYGPW